MTGMPASMALRPVEVICAPSCGSSTMTSGFCEISDSTAGRCSVTSLPAATGTNVTSLYLLACASALAVMAAIQPWSAAGAEKPILMALPGAVLSPWLLLTVWLFVLSLLSLPVHAVSSTPAPATDPTASSRRRDRDAVMETSWSGRKQVHPGVRPFRTDTLWYVPWTARRPWHHRVFGVR